MQTDTTGIRSSALNRRLFTSTPPVSQLKVSVIVPVRNEAHHLVHTLDALRNQQDASSQPLSSALYEVLLLANNCTDESFAVATRYQQRYPDFSLHIAQIILPPEKANIGTVRRLLMDEAHRRLTSTGQTNGIIASTDGDTQVDTHWIYYTMLEIANGNDAVGGRILTRPDRSEARRYHLRDVTYRTLIAKAEARLDPRPNDPWPRHFQHFGASIAVTCPMYERAGRLPEKPFLEDEAFYQALLRTDARVRKSTRVKVFTSTRMQGRIAVGFSEQLRYWMALNQAGTCQLAEPAEAVICRLRNRGNLRRLWQLKNQGIDTTALMAIACDLLIDPFWLEQEIQQSLFFGELWEKVDAQIAPGFWQERWPPVPITTATQALRSYLNTACSLGLDQAAIASETDRADTCPCVDSVDGEAHLRRRPVP